MVIEVKPIRTTVDQRLNHGYIYELLIHACRPTAGVYADADRRTVPTLQRPTRFPTQNKQISGLGSLLGISDVDVSAPFSFFLPPLLVSARRDLQGLPPLGFLGPRLYSAMAANPGGALQDITSGNSATTCDKGFPATKGWDPVTGWGRPVWEGLVKEFSSDSGI